MRLVVIPVTWDMWEASAGKRQMEVASCPFLRWRTRLTRMTGQVGCLVRVTEGCCCDNRQLHMRIFTSVLGKDAVTYQVREKNK